MGPEPDHETVPTAPLTVKPAWSSSVTWSTSASSANRRGRCRDRHCLRAVVDRVVHGSDVEAHRRPGPRES